MAEWKAFVQAGVPCCALLLALAVLAPGEWARTSWGDRGTTVTDSPAGYVGIVSLFGLVALAALAVGWWSLRTRPLAVGVAGLAFAAAVVAVGRYWALLADGAVGVEGAARAASAVSPTEAVRFPALLPLFLAVAALGCGASLLLLRDAVVKSGRS